MTGLVSQFDDAETLASQTPRIALSSQINNLQQIRTQASNLNVPQCLAPAKEELLNGMNYSIDGYLLFLSKGAQDQIDAKFSIESDKMSNFAHDITRTSICAPFCQE